MCIVLAAATPIIRDVVARVQDEFLKVSSKHVEAELARSPLWGAPPGPKRDVRCENGTRGWDDICTFAYRPDVVPNKRMKVGVKADRRSISYVSPPHELDAKHIMR